MLRISPLLLCYPMSYNIYQSNPTPVHPSQEVEGSPPRIVGSRPYCTLIRHVFFFNKYIFGHKKIVMLISNELQIITGTI